MKEGAYKGIGRPVIEYGRSVWASYNKELLYELEKKHSVKRNYVFETVSTS